MRPLLLQSTTTHFAACSSQSSLQIAPALFLHSSASLHTFVRCPAAQSFFSSRGTVFLLPLASPSRLVDIIVAYFLVGCFSALQHPNPPDFRCAFQGTLEPIGSTATELALPGDSQTKGLGPSGSETKCCAPARRCGTPRIETQEAAYTPKIKDYNTH